MGTPADLTIIAMLVVIGAGVWSLWDRLGQLQREVDTLKQRAGVSDPPGA